MNKISTFIIALTSFSGAIAQTDTVYFNASWEQTEKTNAQFYRLPFEKVEQGYILLDFFISGAKQFEGITVEQGSDVYEGKATWFYENGKTEQIANYENGIKQGEFICFDEQGNMLSTGIYKDDTPFEGSFYELTEYMALISKYKNGELIETAYFDPFGESKAKATITITDTEQQNGEIVYFNQNGEWIGNLLVKENYPFEGIYVEYSFKPISVLSLKEISNGVYKSPATYYYSNGVLKKMVYFESDYNYSFKEIYYNTSGNVLDSLLFEDGVPQSGVKIDFFDSYESYVTDKVERISNYQNGELTGSFKTYFPNGKLQIETNYANGDEIGDRITYDTTGEKLFTLSFQAGMPWKGSYIDDGNILTFDKGKRTEEKRFYPNGKLMLTLTSDGIENVYDTTGNVIALLQYKNNEPYDGKKIDIYYYQVESEEIFNKGVKIKDITYNEGVLYQITEYNKDESTSKEISFYLSGLMQKEIVYSSDGSTSTTYFDSNGLVLGKLLMNVNGIYNGDYFEIYDELITEHIQYINGETVRIRNYYNGKQIWDQQANGESYFYDLKNNKTYSCIYKNNEPFEGTILEYNYDYKDITRLASYKNGELDGESIHYSYVYEGDDYDSGEMEPEYVYNYKNGQKKGSAKKYYQGKLIISMNYSNDMLNGDYKSFGIDGELQSSLSYSDDYPFKGVLYDYSYDYPQVSSITYYNNGNMDGEQKYFDSNELSRLELYDQGTLVQATTYAQGKEFILNYKDFDPFDGIKFDSYYYSFYEYKNGFPVSIKTYFDADLQNLESSEVFNGETSVKTTYFENSKKKEEFEYKDYYKEGNAIFYDKNGNKIANGQYVSGIPVSGSFVYFSYSENEKYLLMQIEKNDFRVTEFIDGEPVRKNYYSNTTNYDGDDEIQEIQKFIGMVQYMFDDYTFED